MRGFVKRHNQLLTIVGALIVFITFEVKEGKREQAKSVLESVENARDVFQVFQGQRELSSKINELKSYVKRRFDGKGGPLVEENPFGIQGAVRITLDADAEDFRAIAPNNDALHKTLVRLLAIVPDPLDLKSANQLYDGLVRLRKPDEDPSTAYAVEYKASADLTAITEKTLQKADAFADEQKQQYRLYDSLSKWLFGFGWALGLLPTLFRIEARDARPEHA
jgi:hypothetical protein